jgi:phage terminase large subunit-like protein
MNIYVLDYYDKITHYNDQKKVIKDRFDKYDPIRVAIEANGYQRALLQDMATDPKLSKIRAVPVFTETDKTLRAWKLSAYFERGQVFLMEGMNGLMDHLLRMPDGRYKDLFDALDLAITAAFGNKKNKRTREPGVL